MANSNLPDFTKYDDEKLEDARVALFTECERRQRLGQASAQLQTMLATYLDDGGDINDLLPSDLGQPEPAAE